MNFSQKLRELRIRENLSLAKFALLLQTSPSTLSKYENGEMFPKIDMLLSICSILNCTPNQILGFKNELTLSPITSECATIIESMTASQRQWVFLTIDGLKTSIDNLEKSSRLRSDFIKASKFPSLKIIK